MIIASYYQAKTLLNFFLVWMKLDPQVPYLTKRDFTS